MPNADPKSDQEQLVLNDSSQKSALVTGGALRIGRAVALELASLGYNIGVHYRESSDSARALVDVIHASGRRAVIVKGDLINDNDVTTLVARTASVLGPISCLVNNASVFEEDTLQGLTADSWDTHLSVNLKAPIFLAQSMAAQLPEGARGNIINIVDQRVLAPRADFFSYTLAKSSLHTATRMLAQALAPQIRVNAVAPGPVLQSIHQTPEDFEVEENSTLLGRGATPQEIATAVRFLITAPAVTGQTLVVDGGQHLAFQGND